MPRMRTLKPGFFSNDRLAELPPLGRLLFEGLWCMADREGRLEDRAKRIKAEVLPYDNVNVERLLSALAERGFIQRYEVDDARFIQVTNFRKHQNPHVKEPPSTIPAPCEPSAGPMPPPNGTDTSTGSHARVLGHGSPVQVQSQSPVQEQESAPADQPSPVTGRATQIDDAFMAELEEQFWESFDSRDAVRDSIANALGYKKRGTYTDQRAFLRNWVRSDAERSQTRRSRVVPINRQQPPRGKSDEFPAGRNVGGRTA